MLRDTLVPALRRTLGPESHFWRRALIAGISHGPEAWVRYSPPVFGAAFGAALKGKRASVRRSLRLVHGERSPARELYDITRVFSSYASCLTEAMLLSHGRGEGLRTHARGVEHYFNAAAQNRGVIAVTAHTGGWEMSGAVLGGISPAEVVLVMQREPDERARALHDEARARSGVRVVHVGDSPFDALQITQYLRRRAVVALQIDRVPEGIRRRAVRFFGHPWAIPEGPLRLAAMSGSPLLPVFTRRRGYMDYEAIIAPPILLPRRPSEAELDRAAHDVIGALERFVRAYPTQWYNFA